MSSLIPSTALLSVFDKQRLDSFAQALLHNGCALIASGGTSLSLKETGIQHQDITALTYFPEMMDGRVKTLHPLVHGGILSRRKLDREVMERHKITQIDIVVVNLYPFATTVAEPECTHELAVENIDIGGPTLIRSAAKNHQYVLVVVDPSDYDDVIARIVARTVDFEYRLSMAKKAFQYIADYDIAIANYFSNDEALPERYFFSAQQKTLLRYGENPHQRAAFYTDRNATKLATIGNAQLLQGKELSYNNIADSDAALECVRQFREVTCVIVKHGNPCGVAQRHTALTAYHAAFSVDPTSAFGGVLAFNSEIDGETLDAILDQQFVEVIVAPEFSEDSLEVAKRRSKVRLLQVGNLSHLPPQFPIKYISGGYLIQEADILELDQDQLRCETRRPPTDQERLDLEFAWRVAWFVKSNAIVIVKDLHTLGIGAGQMSRVVSAKLATSKAHEEGFSTGGSVLASDAFFPFRDGIDTAAKAGITAVIQPGGSVRDDEVITAANEHNIAMLFTGIRHFRH